MKLKPYGASKIEQTIEIAIETIKFFPSIAELLEIINTLPPEWLYKENKNQKMTKEDEEELDRLLQDL